MPLSCRQKSVFIHHPSKNLFQCFGCGAAGDAIRFMELFDRVPFAEAVARLSAAGARLPATAQCRSGAGAVGASADTCAGGAAGLTVKDKKLPARVVGFYQNCLTTDRRGLDYLTGRRGIGNLQSIKDFAAGYVNGILNDILPHDPAVIEQLCSMGTLNAKGNEIFYNCVVFPLYDPQGAPCGLYGRRIVDEPAGARHLYLSGPRFGLINAAAVKRSQSIFLTESIIDTLIAESINHQKAREYVYYPGTFEPLAVIDAYKQLYYYHNDINGLPQELTRPDGQIVWSVTYDALGRLKGLRVDEVAQPLRLQGQYWDQEIGLSYNRYRYFDPHICSFISQDPIGLAGGDNVYAYAPNVWGWVDPLGLCADRAATIV